MSLQDNVMASIKAAMKAKDQTALAALRAVKAELLLAKTATSSEATLTEAQENKILAKMVKQRKDSAAIFLEQDRADLAAPELDQAKVISQFLPEALSEAAIEDVVLKTIAELGASGMKDMGKVMGLVSQNLAGQADGKTISAIVKSKLTT